MGESELEHGVGFKGAGGNAGALCCLSAYPLAPRQAPISLSAVPDLGGLSALYGLPGDPARDARYEAAVVTSVSA